MSNCPWESLQRILLHKIKSAEKTVTNMPCSPSRGGKPLMMLATLTVRWCQLR
uniref:Acetyl-CoA acyltransferase 2 n=1 Tax=Myotis myotis TaxID=51298 RepID=A0A7J7VWA9_MYOMY|nr:acetyl-CoA acyltransferase 2 [Myotis myotis]